MEKIAMKCTRAEYESIKELVGKLVFTSEDDFEIYNYLVYKLDGCRMYSISCMDIDRKLYQKFDKYVFLNACGIKVKKDKRTSMFKKALKLIKALDNEDCNITYIGTDSGYDINEKGDTELDGSFTITITGNKTK
jgi:hypothetical protein